MISLFSLLLLGFPLNAHGTTLAESPHFDYEVLFTNPACPAHRYSELVRSVSGRRLRGKPAGAYCTASDASRLPARTDTPLARVLDWIEDDSTQEIFLAYLSFSNRQVARALCSAIEARDVKVTIVLDRGIESEGESERLAAARSVERCRPASGRAARRPRVVLLGHENGLGFAHNKLLIVNPSSRDKIRIGFGSVAAGKSGLPRIVFRMAS